MTAWISVISLMFFTGLGVFIGYRSRDIDDHIRTWLATEDSKLDRPAVLGCRDRWHWETGEPHVCPTCGYVMGEGLPRN